MKAVGASHQCLIKNMLEASELRRLRVFDDHGFGMVAYRALECAPVVSRFFGARADTAGRFEAYIRPLELTPRGWMAWAAAVGSAALKKDPETKIFFSPTSLRAGAFWRFSAVPLLADRTR
jgi:hypothetical protein